MHHPILLTVAAVASFVLGVKAQSGRYRDLVFPSAVVQSDIQYGAAFNPTTPIPGIGTLCIGPPENILVAATGTFGASTRLAAATTSLSLPPGLGGSTFHWQAIHLHATDSRWLTNCTVTAF